MVWWKGRAAYFAQMSSGNRRLHGCLRPQGGQASNYNEIFRRNGPRHAVPHAMAIRQPPWRGGPAAAYFAQMSSGSRRLHGCLRPQGGLASNYNEIFRRNGPRHAVVCMHLFPSEFESEPIKADLQWQREGKQAAAAPRTSFPLHHLASRAMMKVLGMP